MHCAVDATNKSTAKHGKEEYGLLLEKPLPCTASLGSSAFVLLPFLTESWLMCFQSFRNILFGPSSGSPGTSSPDIVSYLIARCAALFPAISLTAHDIASLARQITLLLVGCIILSSVRAVLWQVGRLIKSSSRTRGAAFMLLLLAQLMVRAC